MEAAGSRSFTCPSITPWTCIPGPSMDEEQSKAVLPERKHLTVPCLENIDQVLERCERLGVRLSQPLFPPKSKDHAGKKRRLNEHLKVSSDDSGDTKPKRGGEYEVESILDMRMKDGQLYYFVKWKGWPSETNTWEPRENLEHCRCKLRRFHEAFVGINLNGKRSKFKKSSLDKHHHEHNFKSSKKSRDSNNKPKNGFVVANYQFLLKKKWSMTKSRELTSEEITTYKRLKMQFVHSQKRQQARDKFREWEKEINHPMSNEAYVSVENNIDMEGPPQNFTYINDYKPGEGIIIPDDPLVGCECVPDCYQNREKCCAHQSGGQFAYSPFGRVRVPRGSPIYECNRRCSCNIDCCNRVVQHGRKVKLSIFRTSNGRGWGVKALQKINKGTFVMEYVGEVITNEEAENRGKVYDAEGRTYLFDLDFNGDDCPFTVDAARFGNVSHFMNHSCEPNLVVYAVWINTLDPRLPRIAFFANKNIARGEELTFDYMMTGDTTMAARTASNPSLTENELDLKRIPCKCGSKNCRKYLF